MKIFLTGGTGFIGNTLSSFLEAAGHELTILTRQNRKAAEGGRRRYLTGNPQKEGDWQRHISSHDVLINLAGASIFCRWTEANKKKILDSRLLSTTNLVAPLLNDKGSCKLLINASAVGYYGLGTKESLHENAPPGKDFLANVACRWEEAALGAETVGIRVARCRFGVVLGAGDGALAKMLPAFRLSVGSPLGEGDQPFPWIHVDDLCSAMLHIINNNLDGAFNFVAPQIPTNREFSKCLGRALHRPVLLPAIPAFVLRLVLGEMASVVTDGQKAPPNRLLESKFNFRYEDCNTALGAIITR